MSQPKRRPSSKKPEGSQKQPKQQDESPDQPQPIRSDRASLKSLSWVLRFTVAFMCLAMAADIYVNDSWVAAYVTKQWPETTEHIDQGANWFQSFMSQRFAEGGSAISELSSFDKLALVFLVVASVLVIIWPAWPVLAPIATFMTLNTLALFGTADVGTVWIVPLDHAVRIIAPVALIILWAKLPRPQTLTRFRVWLGMFLLRSATAALFVAQGLMCLAHHPEYLLDIQRLGEMAGFELTENHLSSATMVLGCASLFMALLIFTTKLRLIAGQMALMALIAGIAQGVATAQTDGWLFATPRMMLTGMSAGVPFALMVFWGREKELQLSRRARKATQLQSGWFARLFYRTAAINAMGALALMLVIILNETGAISFKPDKLNLHAFDFMAIDDGQQPASMIAAPTTDDQNPSGITWTTPGETPKTKTTPKTTPKTNATPKTSPTKTTIRPKPKTTRIAAARPAASPPRRMRRTERIRHQQKRSKIEFFGSSFDDDGPSGGSSRKSNPVHDELDRDLGEARRAFHTGRLKEAKQMLESIKSRAPGSYPQGPVDELLRKTNNGLSK